MISIGSPTQDEFCRRNNSSMQNVKEVCSDQKPEPRRLRPKRKRHIPTPNRRKRLSLRHVVVNGTLALNSGVRCVDFILLLIEHLRKT